MRFRPALALGVLLGLSSAAAAAQPWTIDKSHTQIYFQVDHFGFSTTHGLFREFDGTLVLDEQDPARSRVTFTIKTASVDTQFKDRDDHLRSADFLDVAKHPEMRFVSTRVEPSGTDTAKVLGDLTLLGVTRPVTLDVRLNKKGMHPIYQKPAMGFTATAMVRRTEFGMATYAPAIGDEIAVRIDMEAVQGLGRGA
jgi:polyisoprenoid-binding protein YceI